MALAVQKLFISVEQMQEKVFDLVNLLGGYLLNKLLTDPGNSEAFSNFLTLLLKLLFTLLIDESENFRALLSSKGSDWSLYPLLCKYLRFPSPFKLPVESLLLSEFDEKVTELHIEVYDVLNETLGSSYHPVIKQILKTRIVTLEFSNGTVL